MALAEEFYGLLGKGGLTPVDKIVDRVLGGYDNRQYESWHRQLNYAFGHPWDNSSTGASPLFPAEDGIIDFPDIAVNYLRPGESRRIVKGQFVSLSRTMASVPKPFFPDVDTITGIGRQQFWLKRCTAGGVLGGWAHEFQGANQDGHALGLGACRWGVERNPTTGLPRVVPKHVPLTRVLRDRHEVNPHRARWVAFVTYISVEEAALKFGPAKAKDRMRQMQPTQHSSITRPLEVVRVIHYYDVGFVPGDKPTYCCFVGAISKDHAEPVKDNPFGASLPVSFRAHWFIPGMKDPVGNILFQMAQQEAMNSLERRLLSDINTGQALRVYDIQQLNKDDLKKAMKGLTSFLRKEAPAANPGEHAVDHIPAMELHPAILQMWEIVKAEQTEQSGVDEMDRGSMGQKGSTATQNIIQERKSAADENWVKHQVSNFFVSAVETMMKIAAIYDRDPVDIDINGINITINHPARMDSWIDMWLAEPSTVLIDEGSLSYQNERDTRRERMLELQALEHILYPLNPQKYVEEIIQAGLGQDFREWLPAGTQQMLSGAPMGVNSLAGGGQPQPTDTGMPLPSGQGESNAS